MMVAFKLFGSLALWLSFIHMLIIQCRLTNERQSETGKAHNDRLVELRRGTNKEADIYNRNFFLCGKILTLDGNIRSYPNLNIICI